jgi:hypothetical protein
MNGKQGFGNAPRSDIGPIGEYLKDITKLPPEVTRPEQYNFKIRVVNGEVANGFPTPSNRIDPEYVFALRRIKAFISNPTVNIDLAHFFEFNVADQGRARGSIFDDSINAAVLVLNSHDMVWDSFYAFVPGSDMIVDWNVDTTALPLISDVTVGVSLTGDLVRVRRLSDGTLVVPGVEVAR